MSTSIFTLQQMLQEMDIALADEIKKQKVDDRSRRHHVSNGIFISDFNGSYIYEFSLEDPWDVADDTPASIKFDVRQEARGVIIHSTGSTVRIAASQLLPPIALQKAYLVDDPTALLEALRIALKSNNEGKAQLGPKCFGLTPYHAGTQPILGDFGSGFLPDHSQKQAIHMALGSEITYIVGPPGTGKTSTLAAIAFAHICAGRTVLIAAHTNIAVDNAIMRLADMCDQNPQSNAYQLKKSGQIIRLGVPQLATRIAQEYADVHLATIVKCRSGELAQRKTKLLAVRETLNRQIASQEQALVAMKQQQQANQQILIQQRDTHISQLNLLQKRERDRLSYLQQQQQEYRQIREQTQRQLTEIIQQQGQLTRQQIKHKTDLTESITAMNTLGQRLIEAQNTNSIMRIIKHIPSPKTLAQEHANWQQKHWSCEQALAALQQQMERLYQQREIIEQHLQQWNTALDALQTQINTPTAETQQIKQLQESLTQIEQSLAHIEAPAKQLEQQLQALKEQLENTQQQISVLDAQMANVEKQVVTQARMIATTLAKTYMNRLVSTCRFDVVILDEVSMASAPSVYVAASHADQSVTIIGDPQQLSPIVQAKTEMTEKWLNKSLFEIRTITLEAARKNIGNSVILQEQARMHPNIADVAKQYIYNNLLKNSPRILNSPHIQHYATVSPLPGKALQLCDTSDATPVAIRPENGSRMNVYHALCAMEIARQVLATLPERQLQEGEFRIGLIAPYSKQARLLQKLVKDAGLQSVIRVGTIHRFQGLEAEVIIFDTVESPELKISFTRGHHGTEAMRLTNVAITRAQYKLIIIANYQYIIRELSEQDTLRQVVEAAYVQGCIASSSILRQSAPDRLPYQQVGKNHYKPEPLNERSFYERFQQDIRAAHKEIIIYSPFIESRRTQTLLPHLTEGRKNGLSIKVVTSSTNRTSQQAERWLEDIGVKIYKKKNMHEKIAFIDDTIFYVGSLNILSHTNTSEIMERIIAPDSVNELKQIYQTEATEKKPVHKGPMIEIAYEELPKTVSSCKECGRPLILKQRKKDQKPFYSCPVRTSNDRNHTLEEAPYYLPRLTNQRCGNCGEVTKIHATYEAAWIECAADNPCGYQQDIVFRTDRN